MSILKQQRFDLRSTIARKPLDMRQKFIYNAPMVKWISQRSSEPLFWVRILAGAQKWEQSEQFCAPAASRAGVMRQAISKSNREEFEWKTGIQGFFHKN